MKGSTSHMAGRAQALGSQAGSGPLSQPRHPTAGAQPVGAPSPGREGPRPVRSSAIAQEQGLGRLSQGGLGPWHLWRRSGFRATWRTGRGRLVGVLLSEELKETQERAETQR